MPTRLVPKGEEQASIEWTRSCQPSDCLREFGGLLTCQSAGVFEAYQYWAEGGCPIADMIVRLWEVFWPKAL